MTDPAQSANFAAPLYCTVLTCSNVGFSIANNGQYQHLSGNIVTAKHHQFIKRKKPLAAVLFQLQPVYHTSHEVIRLITITLNSAVYNIKKLSQHDGLIRKINASGNSGFHIQLTLFYLFTLIGDGKCTNRMYIVTLVAYRIFLSKIAISFVHLLNLKL